MNRRLGPRCLAGAAARGDPLRWSGWGLESRGLCPSSPGGLALPRALLGHDRDLTFDVGSYCHVFKACTRIANRYPCNLETVGIK